MREATALFDLAKRRIDLDSITHETPFLSLDCQPDQLVLDLAL